MTAKKPKIYIETTIPNFFFDFKQQSSDKKIDTVYFWENRLKDFEPLSSVATIRELKATPDEQCKSKLLNLIKDVSIVELNQEVLNLAERYVKAGLIPQKYSADAIHLAVATVLTIDYLLTWNIQHLAHPSKRKLFREYNIKSGLYVAEIVTPKELNIQLENNN